MIKYLISRNSQPDKDNMLEKLTQENEQIKQ